MKNRNVILIAAACACIDWTRLSGTVKAVNFKAATITIQNRDGDLFTVPIDYQVTISERNGDLKGIKSLRLDEKVTLLRVPADPVKEEPETYMVPERPSGAHGL